jgi:hypothetical protein
MNIAMASLDKDQNGSIDLQEFTLWWISSESRMKAEVTKCFESIDLDGNGYISTDEINMLLQKLGDYMIIYICALVVYTWYLYLYMHLCIYVLSLCIFRSSAGCGGGTSDSSRRGGGNHCL